MKIDYNKIHANKKNFPIFLSTPIKKGNVYEIASSFIDSNSSVLDLGANDLTLKKYLKKKGFKGKYESMDIDKSVLVDYYSLDEIKKKYDFVVMLEVVEHISKDTFFDYLTKIRSKLLKKGGKLIISTPNIGNLYAIRNDSTHISFYPVQELCSILDVFGFKKIMPFRSYHIYKFSNPMKSLAVRLIQIMRHPFTYFFDIDFNCPQIVVVSKNE